MLLLEQLDKIQATILISRVHSYIHVNVITNLIVFRDTLMSNYESNYPTDIESITVLHQKMCESEIAFIILV